MSRLLPRTPRFGVLRPAKPRGRLVAMVFRRRSDGRSVCRPVAMRWIEDRVYRKRRRN